jgi:hypothetical protein
MSHKETVKQKFLEIDKTTGRISAYYEIYPTADIEGKEYDRYTEWDVVWREQDKQYFAFWKGDCPCPLEREEDYYLIPLSLEFDLNAADALINELEDSMDIYWCEQCKDWCLADEPCDHGNPEDNED